MIHKLIILSSFLPLYLSGCSVPQNSPTNSSNSACGSCYWNGKAREASYQKRPSPAVRDWNTGVIYRPPSKHQRVWNGAPPPFGGR